ncbi:MAG: GTPase HflX [Lachnospiraceae bacterium]|nr:GTPase HflX [Lachnospiraceae bacterium]
MKELLETKQELEQVILVGICTQENDDTEESLKELAELVETAGAHPLTMVIQNRESIHPGTYVGKGKIEELRELIDKLHATGIVCDDELSPAQFRNLEDALDTKVMDRTLIILDIFAAHASTKEGKIQVELAQLKYRSARLVGLRSSLSRLGGGIGTRGPGEKKLEMDRRLIKDRIAQLNKELQNVKQSREISRQQRSRNRMPIAAIVGYTNAGKSTLLNKLTDANVLEEDKLFATLDPTTRNLRLSSGQEILLTDTVGFIRKLPHHLIEAFRSTLEEAKYADIILHVVDTSNPQMNTQMQIVYETLKQLEIGNKPIITIFNKKDKLDSDSAPILRDFKADKILSISAKTGEGLNDLLTSLEEVLREQTIYLNYLFSYQDAGKIQSIRKNGQLLKEAYEEDGIRIEAYVPQELYAKITAQKA